MISHVVRKELDGMPPGTHDVLVYDSEERKQDALFTHLKWAASMTTWFTCVQKKPQLKPSQR